MEGFIINSTYRIIDNQPFIFLFGRLENSQSFTTINRYDPYFYIKLLDTKKLPSEIKYEKTPFKNFNAQPVARIFTETPQQVTPLRHELEENNIECYEADIRFTQRFLIDKNIKSTINIEGDYQLGEFTDRIYNEPELTSIKFKPELKIFSIDVETSSDLKKLYSIAIYSKDYKKVLLISKKPVKNAETFSNIEDLLERFKQIILEHGDLSNAQFYGSLDKKELYSMLNNADVLVFPSVCMELFGQVWAEAMALKIPVVASNIAGVGEYVKDLGELFKAGDYVELAEKI